ncbi:MAG: hypothetical protein SWQ30_00735 [Thermodesulfobacteriota bacterium]|nr:hypothetical protein [Thermodesulfobacteriota bacterium]
MNGQGVEFDVYLQAGLAVKVLINSSLTTREVIDCLSIFVDSLNAAEADGFDGLGVYNWEIDGRAIQIRRV